MLFVRVHQDNDFIMLHLSCVLPHKDEYKGYALSEFCFPTTKLSYAIAVLSYIHKHLHTISSNKHEVRMNICISFLNFCLIQFQLPIASKQGLVHAYKK